MPGGISLPGLQILHQLRNAGSCRDQKAHACHHHKGHITGGGTLEGTVGFLFRNGPTARAQDQCQNGNDRRQGQQSPGGGSAVGKQVGRGVQRRGALPQPYCKARRAAHQGKSGQGKVFSHDWPPKPGDRGVCPGITIQLYITQLENTRAMRAEFPLPREAGHSLGRP